MTTAQHRDDTAGADARGRESVPVDAVWTMVQRWHDFLFAHWPVDPDAVGRLLPAPLQVDTQGGRAFVGVVPFRMTGVRLRGLPPVPGLSAFCELNVRTYVTCNGTPGVYFFSLDAASSVAVAVARRWFDLPYYRARMHCRRRGDTVDYASERTDRRGPAAQFRARYSARGPTRRADADPLTAFLLERYCLFTVGRNGRVFRCGVRHAPWEIRDAEVEIETDTMARAAGLDVDPRPPLLHFADEQLVWIGRRSRLTPAA